MYKVLLADDEHLDLEGMKQFIPWTELGLEVVGAVNNGFAACEVMDKLSIDILVTDVNMPNMSGLELARIAIDRKPDIRVVFVSGYQDFHYVKQALSLKACSYVLKPMDDEELIASLHQIVQDLQTEEKRKDEEEQYYHMKPMAKNDLLIRLLQGETTWERPDGIAKIAVSYGLDKLAGPLRTAVLEMDDLEWIQHGDTQSGTEQKLEVLLKEINEVILEHEMGYCFRLSRQRVAVVIHGKGMNDNIHEMFEEVTARLSFSVTIGLGEPVQDVSQLPISYKQALEALDGKMFFGKGDVINYEDVRRAPELSDAKTLDIRLVALFKAMSEYDLVGIHDEIENLFQAESTLSSRFTIYNLAMYIIFKLDQYLHTLDEDLFEMLGMELRSLDVVLKFETIGDIRSWLVRKVFEISEKIHQRKNSKNSKLIREIMNILKERIQENITLKDIAQQFLFSPNYLGHLFKEEVGKSFSEILTGMRMERARELLKDPTLKIYEVANLVGYKYIPYFSRQFREAYGMTPMDFRKRE
ncbi:response regulator [Paenibacillus antarcticus]|uniref:DNA-binding response regulator n=1 Tax=Paenibacillus antarcticus TaxID=253703 RepID=A0A168NI35_9BACL|nr:response regulator [Paenibacillus antarcticus]OAB45820.1 DNA-binding response regulator [Paenibacillus antarcticus]